MSGRKSEAEWMEQLSWAAKALADAAEFCACNIEKSFQNKELRKELKKFNRFIGQWKRADRRFRKERMEAMRRI